MQSPEAGREFCTLKNVLKYDGKYGTVGPQVYITIIGKQHTYLAFLNKQDVTYPMNLY